VREKSSGKHTLVIGLVCMALLGSTLACITVQGLFSAEDRGAGKTGEVVQLSPTATSQIAEPFVPSVMPVPMYVPEPADRPEPAGHPNILFEDDFSDPNSGWEIERWDRGSVGYFRGKYLILSWHKGMCFRGVLYQSFSDVVIDVDTEQIMAPLNNNNGYGVFCRVQPDNDACTFMISGDGYYAIKRVVGVATQDAQ